MSDIESQSNHEQRSSYPALEKPNFESSIPEYLLQNKTEDEQYLLNAVDRMEQKADWTVDAIIKIHNQVRQTNGRLKKVEAWKSLMSNVWVILCIAGGLIVGSATVALYVIDILQKLQ